MLVGYSNLSISHESDSIVTCESDLHPWKAWSSIDVTDCGIVISVNDVHPLKEPLLIETMDAEMDT